MFSTHKFEIKSIGNSIFRIEFYNGADIDISDAELINVNLVKMSEGKKYCVLLAAQNQFTTSPESRAFVANKSSNRIAFAIFTSSVANKLVGNFFIQFNKPNTPTKLFSDEKLAIEWLKGQVADFESSNK